MDKWTFHSGTNGQVYYTLYRSRRNNTVRAESGFLAALKLQLHTNCVSYLFPVTIALVVHDQTCHGQNSMLVQKRDFLFEPPNARLELDVAIR